MAWITRRRHPWRLRPGWHLRGRRLGRRHLRGRRLREPTARTTRWSRAAESLRHGWTDRRPHLWGRCHLRRRWRRSRRRHLRRRSRRWLPPVGTRQRGHRSRWQRRRRLPSRWQLSRRRKLARLGSGCRVAVLGPGGFSSGPFRETVLCRPLGRHGPRATHRARLRLVLSLGPRHLLISRIQLHRPMIRCRWIVGPPAKPSGHRGSLGTPGRMRSVARLRREPHNAKDPGDDLFSRGAAP